MTTTNFASLSAGRVTTRPEHAPHGGESDLCVAGATTFRVSNKHRTFVDVVNYKGGVSGWPIGFIEQFVFKC